MSLKEKRSFIDKGASRLKNAVIDLPRLLFPPVCAACESRNPLNHDVLCLSCITNLSYAPTSQKAIKEIISSKGWEEQAHAAFYSLLLFEKETVVQKLLFQIKYKNRKDLAHHFGRKIGELLKSKIEPGTALVPVPMHKRKLRQRGYNQAEEIAKGIQSRICRTRVVKLLECIKEKPSQTVRSKSGRWSELEGVFKVLDMAGLDRIKHIILVDDVLTTGATLYTCSQEITHKMKTTKISLATMAIAV